MEKLIFSTTLKDTGGNSAALAKSPLNEEVLKLKQQAGKDILVGRRSLIIQLLNSGLIVEFQIRIHPVIEGQGLLLLDQGQDRVETDQDKTTQLRCNSIVL